MASLELTFGDIYAKVSEFIGWGSSPSGTNLTNAQNVVYRGYRNFLFPFSAKRGTPHIWSFLRKDDILRTKDGVWVYNLPEDFGNLGIWFEQDSSTGYQRPVKDSYKGILRNRTSSSYTSYPARFAIKPGRYTKETGQCWEVVFYPTPGDDYYLPYEYICIPSKPSASTDLFIGGTKFSEVILESCLAVAEKEYDDLAGVHTADSEKLIQQLIEADIGDVADTVGPNIDPSVFCEARTRYLHTLSASEIYTD